jgi:CHAD domain-containing protein
VARQILADARSALGAERPDAEAVHDFRREMKRWRSLLRLLDPFLSDEGRLLRNEARDLARTLGGARDAQSALDALADLDGHGLDLSERSLATVRGRIEDIRRAAETTVLNGDMRVRLMVMLDAAGGSVEHWPVDALTFADMSDRLARGFGAARRDLPADWAEADGEHLHELRKRVVNHRYQMETVEPLWPRYARMWINEAQRLRERLGKHQDLLLLEQLIAPHQPLAPWRSRLASGIAARKATHVGAAKRLALRLFVEKPRAFRRKLDVMWETGG